MPALNSPSVKRFWSESRLNLENREHDSFVGPRHWVHQAKPTSASRVLTPFANQSAMPRRRADPAQGPGTAVIAIASARHDDSESSLFSPSPASPPSGQAWADASRADERPGRRFSAGFLAELRADLGVAAAACLGRTGRRGAAACCRCGLDVHDLSLDRRRPGLLGAMGRPAAFAVACGGGCGGSVRMGRRRGRGAAGGRPLAWGGVARQSGTWRRRVCGCGGDEAGAVGRGRRASVRLGRRGTTNFGRRE